MHDHKKQLRTRLKAIRRAMRSQDATLLSREITARALTTINWRAVRSLHVYQPLSAYREVDTIPLTNNVQQRYPHLALATWRFQDDTHTAYWLHDNTAVPAEHVYDAIIVPLLGFNDACQRLGFGGGFYDRFLAAQPHAITIGLCYESGYLPDFVAEAHDIPLCSIITEQNIYRG